MSFCQQCGKDHDMFGESPEPMDAGKYDDALTRARKETGGVAGILIIFGGVAGHGFAVQAPSKEFAKILPELLRYIADHILREPRDPAAPASRETIKP